MEVIHHGSTWIEFNCSCGCVFRATKCEYGVVYKNDYKIDYECRCPECGDVVEHTIIIPTFNLGKIGY